MEMQEVNVNQSLALRRGENECIRTYGLSVVSDTTQALHNESGWFCPAYWDGIFCWPITKAGELATTQCPTYIVGFDNPLHNASRRCLNDGTWFYHPELHKLWTNYSQCYENDLATILVSFQDEYASINDTRLGGYVPLIKTIPRVGYTISFITLMVALTIMFLIKRLHCPRNNLHMNLFASFIFRAFILLLKDLIFVDGVGFSSELKHKGGKTFFYENTQSKNWSCKLFTTLCEFFITANYSWILMEGLYLHNLIFRALFTDSSGSIMPYIIMGWGLPLLVIIPWIVTRLLVENTYCWTTHDTQWPFLFIRIPTMISIIINMVLFIRITKVLFSKLRSSQHEEAQRYKKLAKSTIILMPLFGIHYALFLWMSYYIRKQETVELIWLICDQLFASFQGFFVAMLFCFMNGEVQKEVKPHLSALCSFLGQGLCFCCCCKCRENNLGATKSRSSVCTMMSSTSLYNGVNHHRHKTRCDCLTHSKHGACYDKTKGHICHPNVKSWNDISPRKSLKNQENQYSPIVSKKYLNQITSHSNGSIQAADSGICMRCQNNQGRCKSEPHIGIEMTSMLRDAH